MKIAVYGIEELGQALGFRFAENGHTVTFSDDDTDSAAFESFMEKATCFGAISAPLPQAATDCQYFVITTSFFKALKSASRFPDFGPRILIDCTGPLNTPSGAELPPPDSTLQLRKAVRGGRFVKAFNSVGAPVLSDSTYPGNLRPLMLLCGEDETALEKVSILCDDLGFQPAVAGDLDLAPQLDAMARLWASLARQEKWGPGFTWAGLNR